MKKNINGYKIKTVDGWKSFSGMRKTCSTTLLTFVLSDNSELTCTENHLIFYNPDECREANTFSVGDSMFTQDGCKTITQITTSKGDTEVYDILDVQDGNKFLANDILVHNCEFIGRQGTLIESSVLRNLINKTRNTTYQYIIDNDIRFYKEFDITKRYLVALDPSIGVENDFAAIQMFEVPGFKQIAEWKNDKINQNEQVEKLKTLIDFSYKKLKELGSKSPEIYWSFENNTCGDGFLCALREKSLNVGYEYPQDYIKRGRLISQIGNKRIGFTTDKRTKSLSCSRMKVMIEKGEAEIYSKPMVMELSNFTANKSSYASSKPDDHDDLITSFLIVIMMYLQDKNKLDLDVDVNDFVQKERDDKKYELPFLFFSN